MFALLDAWGSSVGAMAEEGSAGRARLAGRRVAK